MKKEAILLSQIIEEINTPGKTQTDPMEHALNRIYTEIFPLPQTLPTLIFGEKHSDPDTSKIVIKLTERLSSMKHSFSFYEELTDTSYREKFLKLSRIEMETGEDPFVGKPGEEKPFNTTTHASRASRVKMDDAFLSQNIPVECVDHPDRMVLFQQFKDNPSDYKTSDFITLRDDYMAAHYLTGHGVIGIMGLTHFEGIQQRIQAQFISANKESAAGANYCFFNIYSGSSAEESKFFKEAKLPFEVTRVNLDEMSEDDAVEFILKTIKKAQKEMQTKGYWRSGHLLPEKNPDTLMQLLREISSPGHSETKDEKITPILPSIPEETLTSLFNSPNTYRKELINLLKKGYCPQKSPDNFKEFLILEALAGRFEFLLLLKEPPVNFIFAKTTLLHAAVAANRLDVISFLLKHKPPVNVQNSKGLTPLHIAAKNDNPKITRWLLFYGAQTDLPDKNGQTAEEISSPSIKGIIKETEELQKNLKAKHALSVFPQTQKPPRENSFTAPSPGLSR